MQKTVDVSLKGKLPGNGQMVNIFMIRKIKLAADVHLSLSCG